MLGLAGLCWLALVAKELNKKRLMFCSKIPLERNQISAEIVNLYWPCFVKLD